MQYLESIINSGLLNELKKSDYMDAFEQLKISGRNYKPGEPIFFEGDLIDKFCIIRKGSVRSEKTYLNGEVHIVDLFEEGSISIREMLDQDELDFGIIITSNASSSLNILPMTRSQLVVCVPASSELAKKDKISNADIAKSSLIVMKEGSYLRQIVQDRLRSINVSPNIVLESGQITTIKGLVAHNVGIAFLLDFIADDSSGICSKPLEDPIFVDIGLAWKKERYVSKAAQAFINFCKKPI